MPTVIEDQRFSRYSPLVIVDSDAFNQLIKVRVFLNSVFIAASSVFPLVELTAHVDHPHHAKLQLTAHHDRR
jgi:hypothetical protein